MRVKDVRTQTATFALALSRKVPVNSQAMCTHTFFMRGKFRGRKIEKFLISAFAPRGDALATFALYNKLTTFRCVCCFPPSKEPRAPTRENFNTPS